MFMQFGTVLIFIQNLYDEYQITLSFHCFKFVDSQYSGLFMNVLLCKLRQSNQHYSVS